MAMKRDRLDFGSDVRSLRERWWHADIVGPRLVLTPGLAHALECAYYAGSLQTLGLALGWPGDDCRARMLALQREAAQRLTELQADRDRMGSRIFSRASNVVRDRAKQHDKRFR